MAIKKVNRGSIAKALETKVTPVVETEEIYNEQEREMEVAEETIAETIAEPVVEKQPVKVVTKPAVTKTVVKNEGVKKMNNVIKEEVVSTGKRTLGNKPAAKAKKEQVLGNVYSKDRLIKDVQLALDEKFEGVSLVDCKFILEAVEKSIYDAACQASLRMFGGILKASKRNQLIAKSPKTEYTSFTDAREVMTLTGSEIGQPEKYRGQVNGKMFTIEQAYDYTTGKWVEAEGSFELDN